MNKIQIDKDKIINLENDEYQLIINNDCNIEFIVNKNINSKVSILVKSSNINIKILLESNSSLIINQLGCDSSINYDVNINNNSNLYVVDSIISKVDSINNINLSHKGNNSEIKFYTNGINLDNKKMYYNVNGIISKDISDVYLEENSKIINIKDGDSKIIPNLIVDSKDISANHSAYIGTLDNETLNYLMSRGIEKDKAKDLIIKSILLSKRNLNIDEFIKEICLYIEGGEYE